MLSVFLRGLLIGFSIAAPVGPIGLLCIRRRVADGRMVGFVSGLGAATADAFYGAVAGFGLTVVSGALVHGQTPLRLVGGAFLCYLGVRTFLARPAPTAAVAGPPGAAGRLCLYPGSHPDQPVDHSLVRGDLRGAGPGKRRIELRERGPVGGGGLHRLRALVADPEWSAGVLRGRLTPVGLRWMNRLSAVILAGFGVAALVSVWPGG